MNGIEAVKQAPRSILFFILMLFCPFLLLSKFTTFIAGPNTEKAISESISSSPSMANTFLTLILLITLSYGLASFIFMIQKIKNYSIYRLFKTFTLNLGFALVIAAILAIAIKALQISRADRISCIIGMIFFYSKILSVFKKSNSDLPLL